MRADARRGDLTPTAPTATASENPFDRAGAASRRGRYVRVVAGHAAAVALARTEISGASLRIDGLRIRQPVQRRHSDHRGGHIAGETTGRVDVMYARALVLAGGGVAGIAWELGVLLGIRDGAAALNPPIEGADLIIGTSAGSTVAAQISTGEDLTDLFERQLSEESSEIEVEFDLDSMMATIASATADATSPEDMGRRIGAAALVARTVPEDVRRRAVAGRLRHRQWPDRPVMIVAVDAETGELTVFTRETGVDLVDAVAASCAVPGIWPPVTINGRRYIDGGARSAANADLAVMAERVLVIIPAIATAEPLAGQLEQQIASLRPADVLVVAADDAALRAFGSNPLSPSTRRPAALAGRSRGQNVAGAVQRFWQ